MVVVVLSLLELLESIEELLLEELESIELEELLLVESAELEELDDVNKDDGSRSWLTVYLFPLLKYIASLETVYMSLSNVK